MSTTLDLVACDPRVAMNEALAEGRCELEFASASEAKAYRMRCYAMRRAYRDKSIRIFDPFNEGYDTSPWDGLGIKVSGNMLHIRVLTAASIGLVDMKGNAK